MTTLKKKYIYLPQNLNPICQVYNNGYIIWMSGTNSTGVQYLDNTKNISLNILMNSTTLTLKKSNLTRTQTCYNIYQKKEEKLITQYYNLIHMQLKKAVLNATVGIKKYLLVRGVGYKFIKKNQYLILQVGYSHKINLLIPSYVKTKLNRKSTKIKFFAYNLTFLTGLLSSIRKFKKPDVYKGKGIRYRKDNIMRKEGKKKKVSKNMPTLVQLTRKSRKKRIYKNRRPALDKCPQKKATCLRVFQMTPRKPNSALRKVAWILLSNRKRVHAYIPGMWGNTLQKHSVVLIRGGRVKDLPGMKYTIIRGKFDLKPIYKCRKARSKYGVKRVLNRVDNRYKKFKYW